jgi:hypothetical protein
VDVISPPVWVGCIGQVSIECQGRLLISGFRVQVPGGSPKCAGFSIADPLYWGQLILSRAFVGLLTCLITKYSNELYEKGQM